MSSHDKEQAPLKKVVPSRQSGLACPECGGNRCRRARRKGVLEEGPFRWLRLNPVFCRDCGIRFYTWRRVQASRGPDLSPLRITPRQDDELRAIVEQMKVAEAAK